VRFPVRTNRHRPSLDAAHRVVVLRAGVPSSPVRITSGARIVCQSRRSPIVLHFSSGRAPKNVPRAARRREAHVDRARSSISFGCTKRN